MNQFPNSLTPAECAVVRQTFAIFELILDPELRAQKQARLILACISRGVSLRLVVQQ